MILFTFTTVDGTAKLSGRDHGVRESTLSRDQPVRSEDLRRDLQGNSEKSQPIDETKGDAEARNVFLVNRRDYIYRHHVDPRVQLCRKKKHSQDH